MAPDSFETFKEFLEKLLDERSTAIPGERIPGRSGT
jgi:hypothetical protein